MSDGRWRRVYSLSRLEAGVQRLSDGERVVWLYCMTGPQSTSVGIYRLSTALAVEDLANIAGPDEFERRFQGVCDALGWRFDSDVRVLWIPTWLEENPPQSPNVVVSWRKLLNNVPDCVVKAEAVNAIHQYLKDIPEAFREAFGSYRVSLPKDFSKPKAKTKAKPESDQGTGIREFGSTGNRESSALRAGAFRGDESQAPPTSNTKLLAIASEVLTANPRTASTEELVDHFLYIARESKVEANRRLAIDALALAQSRSA